MKYGHRKFDAAIGLEVKSQPEYLNQAKAEFEAQDQAVTNFVESLQPKSVNT